MADKPRAVIKGYSGRQPADPDAADPGTLLFSATVRFTLWGCPVRPGATCEDAACMPRENHVACRLTE